jgi:WD40 repeat protein
MQLTAWQKSIPRKLSLVGSVFLAVMILVLVLSGYHLVQWLNPGSRITPRTVGNLEEVPILIRHDAAIRSIVFNPQPNADLSFVSSSRDRLIKLWQLDKGSATEKFAVQAGTRIALSPDGKLLASLDSEDGAKLWGLTQTDTLFHSLQDNQESYALSFSPDGQILASGNATGMIKLWDWQHGKPLHTLKASETEIIAIAFSPDGQTLASSDGDKTTKLWNWKTGKVVRTFQGDIGGGDSITFSPNGQTLASGDSDGKMQTITLLDWSSSQVIQTIRIAASSSSDVVFSPDGQILASNSDDGIKLWNNRNGKEVLTIKEGRSPFTFSPDGQTLASGSDDGIKLWNGRDGRLIRDFQGREEGIVFLTFSPDGRTLMGGSYEGKIILWNQRDGTERLGIKIKGVSGAFASSPDGQTLAIGSGKGGIKLLSLNPQAQMAYHPLNVKLKNSRFVAFSPAQQNLILAGSKEIKQLRLKDHQEIRNIQAEPGEFLFACALSPDGEILATGEFNGPIKLWNLHDGKIIRTLETGSDNTVLSTTSLSVTFSPDGQMLASAFPFKNTIQVWNLRNGHLIHQWEANRVNQVVFSTDGQVLASGNGDGEVQLWNPQTGKKLRTLKGHGDRIGALAFSPDGQTLASGSNDQTIKLWRVKQ